jgi:hypothetical protein
MSYEQGAKMMAYDSRVRRVGLVAMMIALLFNAEIHAQAPANSNNLVIGIEIGGSAVKATPVSIQNGIAKTFGKDSVERTTGVVTGVQTGENGKKMFSSTSIEATAEAVAALKKYFHEKYPTMLESQFVYVASSGVVSAAENFDDLKTAIKAKIKDAELKKIDSAQEVKLTLLGIARLLNTNTNNDVDLTKCALIDIGSGNIKYGYLEAKDGKWEVRSAEVSYGVKVFSDYVRGTTEVAKATDDTRLDEFEKQAKQLRKTLIEAKLKESSILEAREPLYLTGGTPYSLVSYIHPEKHSEKTVLVDSADVQKYSALNIEGLTKIENEIVDVEAKKNVAGLKTKFTREQTIAGGQLLDAVLNVLPRTDSRKLTFVRDAQFLWLQEYILEANGVKHPQAPQRSPQDDKVVELQRKITQLEEQLRNQKVDVVTIAELRKSIDKVAEHTKQIADRLPKDPVTSSDVRELKETIQKLQVPTQHDTTQKKRVYNENAAIENFRSGMSQLEKRDFLKAREFFQAAVNNYDFEPRYWYALALSQLASCDKYGATASIENLWDLHDRGIGLTLGDSFTYIQGFPRIAVEDLVKEVRQHRNLVAVRPRSK